MCLTDGKGKRNRPSDYDMDWMSEESGSFPVCDNWLLLRRVKAGLTSNQLSIHCVKEPDSPGLKQQKGLDVH
jgi:hypothetical protein